MTWKNSPNSRLPVAISMLCGFLVILAARVRGRKLPKRVINLKCSNDSSLYDVVLDRV